MGDGGYPVVRGAASSLVGSWPMAVALVVMWIALWGRLSVANVASGALVALAVLLLARGVRPRAVRHVRAVPALRYLGTFLQQLVIANYQVALAVLRPARTAPGIIAVHVPDTSDAVVTLVANSITLTPGTLTLETERRDDTVILYVHALDLSDVEAVRDDIRQLHRRALDAFGGDERDGRGSEPA
ncbi:MAG TPA: Na+/H+ antiporter subunit E [Euzebyales bacterium]|nr:Na+/H+ antiporter subunit E [Euzebyales bacterium]